MFKKHLINGPVPTGLGQDLIHHNNAHQSRCCYNAVCHHKHPEMTSISVGRRIDCNIYIQGSYSHPLRKNNPIEYHTCMGWEHNTCNRNYHTWSGKGIHTQYSSIAMYWRHLSLFQHEELVSVWKRCLWAADVLSKRSSSPDVQSVQLLFMVQMSRVLLHSIKTCMW